MGGNREACPDQKTSKVERISRVGIRPAHSKTTVLDDVTRGPSSDEYSDESDGPADCEGQDRGSSPDEIGDSKNEAERQPQLLRHL